MVSQAAIHEPDNAVLVDYLVETVLIRDVVALMKEGSALDSLDSMLGDICPIGLLSYKRLAGSLESEHWPS